MAIAVVLLSPAEHRAEPRRRTTRKRPFTCVTYEKPCLLLAQVDSSDLTFFSSLQKPSPVLISPARRPGAKEEKPEGSRPGLGIFLKGYAGEAAKPANSTTIFADGNREKERAYSYAPLPPGKAKIRLRPLVFRIGPQVETIQS